MVGMLYWAGVPLVSGTDTPLPIMAPGRSLLDEIGERFRADLLTLDASPLESLATLARPVVVMAAGRWFEQVTALTQSPPR